MNTIKHFVAIFVIVSAFSATASANETYGSYDDDPYKPFDATDHQYETMTISWKVVSNVTKECNNIRVKKGFQPYTFEVNACSFWNKSECVIVTKKKPTMHSVGHEMRHCFEKNWH